MTPPALRLYLPDFANGLFGLRFCESGIEAVLPCLLRASTRDAWLTEQGVAPAGVGPFPTSQGAMPSSAPDEGAAFNGRARSGEGPWQHGLEQRKGSP